MPARAIHSLGRLLWGSDRFDRALAKFAQIYAEQIYADQNRRDHEAPEAPCRSGRITGEQR
ncbi:hypothetical protein GCM10010271_08190 [Streptomyces kurssanovii]|nr:hypothetical protein GCM10010271_08190 [Streptomyces kurssanovii]